MGLYHGDCSKASPWTKSPSKPGCTSSVNGSLPRGGGPEEAPRGACARESHRRRCPRRHALADVRAFRRGGTPDAHAPLCEGGRRSTALRQSKRASSFSARELGVEPEAETRDLYRRLVAERSTKTPARPQRKPTSLAGRAPGAYRSPAVTPLIGREADLAWLKALRQRSRRRAATSPYCRRSPESARAASWANSRRALSAAPTNSSSVVAVRARMSCRLPRGSKRFDRF